LLDVACQFTVCGAQVGLGDGGKARALDRQNHQQGDRSGLPSRHRCHHGLHHLAPSLFGSRHDLGHDRIAFGVQGDLGQDMAEARIVVQQLEDPVQVRA
jgi:hypothetical protein